MKRLLIALFIPATALVAQKDGVPTSGVDVLERMRAAYAGKWYHTLTFTQKTTMYDSTGKPSYQTWYESLRHTGKDGTQLRIDFGEPSAGRGVLYTADSLWIIRDGKLASQRGEGNEFLPLIEGVYVQPVEQTVRELKPAGIDMNKVHASAWQDRPVWVVGSAGPADSTSPQFWVDTDRKVVVRFILSFGAGQPPFDVHLDNYERTGDGWLATKIAMFQGGKPRQTEEYSDWKVSVELDPRLFDPATWTTARHWRSGAGSGPDE